MDDLLGMPGRDLSTPDTPGMAIKVVWNPNSTTSISLARDPYDVSSPAFHRQWQYHIVFERDGTG